MVCGNFILPEPASYVFFYAFFNLRKLLYIIEIKNLLLATDTLTDAERATCNGRWTVSPKPSGGGKA